MNFEAGTACPTVREIWIRGELERTVSSLTRSYHYLKIAPGDRYFLPTQRPVVGFMLNPHSEPRRGLPLYQ